MQQTCVPSVEDHVASTLYIRRLCRARTNQRYTMSPRVCVVFCLLNALLTVSAVRPKRVLDIIRGRAANSILYEGLTESGRLAGFAVGVVSYAA